jgi:hypothetical protein
VKTQQYDSQPDRYPPPPRPRLRVVRFAGGSGPVTGDEVSVCFRFNELDIEEVVVADVPGVEPDPEGCAEVDAGPGGCGTVLCCFCGELFAD